ncbi:PREDICTED: DNA repair protein RAD4 isoform X2 [Tarenaya hassleriana]|nr:PREDICTED: DNA repair protein RAD4 isoform X2 [Tarenaya hassleriana]
MGCSSKSGNSFAGGDDDEINDSDWEECSIPSLDHTVNASVDDIRELRIEFDGVPDAKSQKHVYRATAEDKERAELVHKVHLLSLLARGRIVDKACDDPLIQASLLSLLPSYLSKVSVFSKITVKDIAPLLRWFRGVFSVRDELRSGKSFSSSLAFAFESRQGTTEELAALTVALFRALKLTTRFVSILDVASLKPGVDKDESSGQNRNKMNLGIFGTSTLMVSTSPVKSENEKLREKSKKDSAMRKDDCSTSNKNTQPSFSIGTNPQCELPPSSNQFKDKMDSSSEAETCCKPDGTRRKGDLEFEMQLAMALAATAAANTQDAPRSDEKSLSSSSSKATKKIENASVSDQVISTAVGSKKVGSPLYWAEVYCNGENMDGRWVHFDAVNGMIDAEQSIEAAADACKASLRYVVAFAGGGAKDVTRRYCTKWHKIASKRVSPQWWDLVLAPLRQLESAATGGSVNMEKEPLDANDPIPVTNKASTSSSSIGIRSALEDMELATRALTEPLPTNQQAYKNHELYAIEKWLRKNQILHPKGPILGYCSGHPVFPRTCVQTLRTKERWLREGLQVKPDEVPEKILRRNSKHKKVVNFEDGEKDGEGGSQCMELYGKWQLEPLRLPHAVNGIVPKNERGQVDVWSEKCLPPGTVHIRLPRIFLVAKRLGVDYAPAMVGFDYKNGRPTPVFDGIVVCTEFKDAILQAFGEEEERREAEEKRRNEARAATRWYQLLSSILTREKLKTRYLDSNQPDGIQASSAGPKAETVVESPGSSRRGSKRPRPGLRRGETSKGDDYNDNSRRVKGLVGESEGHEHVFLVEEETFDEGSLLKTKRCRCGFAVQVEQM